MSDLPFASFLPLDPQEINSTVEGGAREGARVRGMMLREEPEGTVYMVNT